MPLQWRSQIWQSLEEGAGKRCSECACAPLVARVLPYSVPGASGKRLVVAVDEDTEEVCFYFYFLISLSAPFSHVAVVPFCLNVMVL